MYSKFLLLSIKFSITATLITAKPNKNHNHRHLACVNISLSSDITNKAREREQGKSTSLHYYNREIRYNYYFATPYIVSHIFVTDLINGYWVLNRLPSQLVVPDDQVGVAVVDLRQVPGLVPLHLGRAPLDVAPAPHQSCHCFLSARFLFGMNDTGAGSRLLARHSPSDLCSL